MMALAIGALRQRVVIEMPVRSQDEAGGATVTWQTFAEAWARIAPARGREIATADGLSARLTHEITLRHRAGMRPDMRLRLGNRLFQIHAVVDVAEKRRHLMCFCEETIT